MRKGTAGNAVAKLLAVVLALAALAFVVLFVHESMTDTSSVSEVIADGTSVVTDTVVSVSATQQLHDEFVSSLNAGNGPRVVCTADDPEAPYASYYYYNQLSDQEKSWYRTIYEAAYLHRDTVTFGNTYDEDMMRVFHCVRQDSPEFFYLDQGGTYTYDNFTTTLAFNYICDAQETKSRIVQMDAALDEDLARIEAQDSTVEKLREMHDIIAVGATYNQEAAESDLSDDAWNAAYPDINTSYGTLVLGDAVCGGYAMAFEYLCHLSGIPCLYETGEANTDVSSGGHAWNLVEADGIWSVVDVTWDDDDNAATENRYDFFLVSDGEHDVYVTKRDLLTALPEGREAA